MASVLIQNAAAVLPNGASERSTLLVTDGLITAIGGDDKNFAADTAFDAKGATIYPGSIDVHIHGAVGIDVNESDADGLFRVAEFLARQGVTAWMPTLVPDSDENYRRIIGEIDRLMELQEGKPVAQAVGVHYEGVFANEKMCGALRAKYFKTFTGVELSELPRLKSGVHMMTFAPEVEGGSDLAREMTRQNWVASIGHTRAGTDVLEEAFEAGATHCTHFFNAMTGLHHRDLGVVGWAFAKPGVTFDIIADGRHVHPQMLEFACRAKKPDNVSLISDSVAPTGLGDGSFELWGEKITVENGITRNERGSIAGSVITMYDAFLRMRSLGFTDAELAKLTSTNPSKLLGLDGERGSIEVGKRADLVGIAEDGSIKFVMIGGQFVDLN